MMILITGGSASGKSAYAEACIGSISEGCGKYYIATMQGGDSESEEKIRKHRSMRAGKGFLTIEQPTDIGNALGKMTAGGQQTDKPKQTALLECISNLAANEMFSGDSPVGSRTVISKVVQGVAQLKNGVRHLVVVTNNIMEDGIVYDEMTMEYMKAMSGINRRLAELADQVVEVVVGIPILLKEGNEYANC